VIVARVIVALAARLLPVGRRTEWRNEWLAEMWHVERRQDSVFQRTVASLQFAAGSVSHAITLRRLERNPHQRPRSYPMQSLVRDIRHAFRAFRRTPGFVAVIVLTTALGVGATTAVFSVVDGVIFRKLSYANADELVLIGSTSTRFPGLAPVNPMDFFDWRRENTVFSHLSAVDGYTFDLIDGEEPVRIGGAAVTEEFFDLLGAGALLGRTFRPGDDVAGGERIVVLSHDLWRRRFGADSSVIGRRIFTADQAYTVIGVMPPGFRHPEAFWSNDVELWMPLSFIDNPLTSRGPRFLQVVGRLGPGVTIADARTEMNAIGHRLAALYPQNADRLPLIEPLHAETVGDVGSSLFLLLGAVGLLLLIACVNIANLLLARATVRSREMSLRRALGASAIRIYQQLVIEGVVLALAGGILGIVLSFGAVRLFQRGDPVGLPRIADVAVDLRVLGFAVTVSAAVGLLFTLVPALRLARSKTLLILERNSLAVHGTSRVLLRHVLVSVELALAVMLVIGAGLFSKSFANLRAVDPGFDPDGAITLTVDLSDAYDTADRRMQHLEAMAARFREIPGVRAVAYASSLPFTGDRWITGFRIEGRERSQDPQVAVYSRVSPGFFATMGMRLVDGRDFTPTDVIGQPDVIVVNEAFAREYLAGTNVIGSRVATRGMNSDAWYTVVGVVGDVSRNRLNEPADPEFYLSALQRSTETAQFVVRTANDREGVIAALRNRAWELDSHMPLLFDSMEQALGAAVSRPRFLALLMVGFASLALFLAALGVYGTVSYVVGRRHRELGIRMALGASRGEVVRMVVRQAAVVTTVGLAVGVVASVTVGRLVEGLLFGVGGHDVSTYVEATLFLTAVALTASFIPARRAARNDPVAALRTE